MRYLFAAPRRRVEALVLLALFVVDFFAVFLVVADAFLAGLCPEDEDLAAALFFIFGFSFSG